MKNAHDLLIELYALKLAKNDLLWDIRTMSRTTDNYSKINIDYSDIDSFKQTATSFITPVFLGLNNPKHKLNDRYQLQLLKTLQNARATNIIDKSNNILDIKQFTNNVLKKCVLPAYIACMNNTSELDTNWLFYSLTGVNFARIIQEQTKSVFDCKTYAHYDPAYKNGVVHNPHILHNAIQKCGYSGFATMDEIEAAVDTDDMDLFRTMVPRMFERVKK